MPEVQLEEILGLVAKWGAVERKIIGLKYQLMELKVKAFDIERMAEIEVSFDPELKNDAQRKARKFELMQARGMDQVQEGIRAIEKSLMELEVEGEILTKEWQSKIEWLRAYQVARTVFIVKGEGGENAEG